MRRTLHNKTMPKGMKKQVCDKKERGNFVLPGYRKLSKIQQSQVYLGNLPPSSAKEGLRKTRRLAVDHLNSQFMPDEKGVHCVEPDLKFPTVKACCWWFSIKEKTLLNGLSTEKTLLNGLSTGTPVERFLLLDLAANSENRTATNASEAYAQVEAPSRTQHTGMISQPAAACSAQTETALLQTIQGVEMLRAQKPKPRTEVLLQPDAQSGLVMCVHHFFQPSECERVIRWAEQVGFANAQHQQSKEYAYRSNSRLAVQNGAFAAKLYR
eukprot:g82730.t1